MQDSSSETYLIRGCMNSLQQSGNTMAGQDSPDKPQQEAHQIFDWMIPLAGIVLVLFATAMFGLFPRTPNNVLIAIALFGVGCAALWFGLMHADVHATENKIQRIKQKADRVRDLLMRSKK